MDKIRALQTFKEWFALRDLPDNSIVSESFYGGYRSASEPSDKEKVKL